MYDRLFGEKDGQQRVMAELKGGQLELLLPVACKLPQRVLVSLEYTADGTCWAVRDHGIDLKLGCAGAGSTGCCVVQ